MTHTGFERSILVIVSLLASLLLSCAVSAGEGGLAERYDAMAIQGDLSDAASLFDTVPAADRSDSDRALVRAFESRFGPVSRRDDATNEFDFVATVVSIYRNYWRSALLGEPAAEDHLITGLSTLLNVQPDDFVYTALGHALNERDIHHDERPGPPLRDLLLWKEERRARYTVELTDRTVHLAVNFIDGIQLQGWKDYASLGRVSTTGWVHEGELYCLSDAYDVSSENFRVSFLKHEARHLADIERWPEMGAVDLEYRAKLTELVYSVRGTQTLLDDLASKAAPNPESPHAMANWRVVNDLYGALFGNDMPPGFKGWKEAGRAAVPRAARRLLKNDTKRRMAAGI